MRWHTLCFWGLLPLALLGLSGCQLFFDVEGGSECRAHEDCLPDQRCELSAGRCVTGARPTPDATPLPDMAPERPDADLPDASPPDAELAAPEDMGLDAAPGGEDAGEPLVQLSPSPQGPLPFPDGVCFPRAQGALEALTAARPPRGWCDPGGPVWLVAEEDSALMRMRYVNTPEGDPIDGPRLHPAASVVLDGTSVLYEDLLAEPPTIRRLDRTADMDAEVDADDPLEESLRGQRQPTRWRGISGFVEEGNAGERRVILVDEEGFREDCGEGLTGVVQWGPAINARRIGWFERRVGSGRVDLVLTAGLSCSPRIAFPVGQIDAEAQLQVDGDRWIWMARGDDGLNTLQVLRFSDRARGPQTIDLERRGILAPVEFAAGAGRLAVVEYRPQGHRLALIRWADDTLSVLGAPDNVRHPTISARFVLWAGQGGTGDWEVRYEALDPTD